MCWPTDLVFSHLLRQSPMIRFCSDPSDESMQGPDQEWNLYFRLFTILSRTSCINLDGRCRSCVGVCLACMQLAIALYQVDD